MGSDGRALPSDWMAENKQSHRSGKKLTSGKAREILRHGEVQGHDLTAKQKRFFGAVAGGQRPRKP